MKTPLDVPPNTFKLEYIFMPHDCQKQQKEQEQTKIRCYKHSTLSPERACENSPGLFLVMLLYVHLKNAWIFQLDM